MKQLSKEFLLRLTHLNIIKLNVENSIWNIETIKKKTFKILSIMVN